LKLAIVFEEIKPYKGKKNKPTEPELKSHKNAYVQLHLETKYVKEAYIYRAIENTLIK